MPNTAWATIATATILSPLIAPVAIEPERSGIIWAKAKSSNAEGSVNPMKAASAPSQPARINPSAKPTWLDAGPGRNWHSATRSA